MREHDLHSRFGNAVAEDVVIGATIGHEAETVQRFHTLAADYHCGTESELHAFQQIGHDYARGHFHRIAQSFESGPESPAGQAAKDTGGHSYFGIFERLDDLAQVVGRDAHVAVADHEQIVHRLLPHLLERIELGVCPRWFAAGHEAG